MTDHSDDVSRSAYGVAPPGFRLPGDSRPGPVRLQVAALKRSLEYYTQVLGFRVARRTEATACSPRTATTGR